MAAVMWLVHFPILFTNEKSMFVIQCTIKQKHDMYALEVKKKCIGNNVEVYDDLSACVFPVMSLNCIVYIVLFWCQVPKQLRIIPSCFFDIALL